MSVEAVAVGYFIARDSIVDSAIRAGVGEFYLDEEQREAV